MSSNIPIEMQELQQTAGQTDRFEQQIEAFGHWKANLIKQMADYQEWLDEHDLSSPEQDLRLMEMQDRIRADRITVAFVAEVSSGKTELINAIFFPQYKRRLLPSSAGRTTMCPTEFFHDAREEQPYMRLLPIETRLESSSIGELKRRPSEWSKVKLDVNSPDDLVEAFEEVTRVKKVTVEQAKRLGLYESWRQAHGGGPEEVPLEIEIPAWRHAVVSFPHPLLEQGLVVLDTPGLNALGSEPELTLNMLPKAHAVLFLLSADTGVTKSDMDMWTHNIRAYRSPKRKGLLVVLNKIDTLWDELQPQQDIDSTIAEQCRKSAEMLDVPEENVFPISAQKGLLARVKEDQELLDKSGIPLLEQTLASDVLPEKHRLIQENIVGDFGNMVQTSGELLVGRLEAAQSQLTELKSLSGKNLDVITHLMGKTRDEQIVYNKNVESLQASRRVLSRHAKALLDNLSISALDQLVGATRHAMSGSWTTVGLKSGMKVFFERVHENIAGADREAEQTRKLVAAIYHKFHKDHGLAKVNPESFSTTKYVADVEELYREAEAFRNSPVTTMTEQSFVVKKFFITLVSRARNIFFNAHHDADTWTKSVLGPLISQIRDHRAQIERRLETLRKINDSRDTLESKIGELERDCADLKDQIRSMEEILRVVSTPPEL